MSPTRTPRSTARSTRRRTALGLVAAAALVLTGCAAADDEPVAARPTQTEQSPDAGDTDAEDAAPTRPPLPDVPVRSADLQSLDLASTVEPASLSIPSLDITLPIDPVGVEDDGQMEIPPLAERGGWYRYGASPGQDEGTAVIAAHVDSVASAGLGPFARLVDAEVGTTVEVTLADSSTVQYTVTDVTVLAKPQVTWPDVFVRDGEHRLVLVTCGGAFQRDARSYTDNVIVTAVPAAA